MSHYTIHQDDDTSKPVHTYRWSLLKDGKLIGALYSQADAETIRAALNELDSWRGWAQFVYLGGGPVTLADAELRAAVCEAHDAELLNVNANRHRLETEG